MIAISYRRDDSLPIAGRLYDRLQAKFGKHAVFMDFDSIRPGLDFRTEIRNTINRAEVVIALIGSKWTGSELESGRRIDDPDDFVRLEISHALKRDIPIIPVLVNNSPLPKPETLPEELRPLVFRHALPLDSGLDFHQHADRVIGSIEGLLRTERRRDGLSTEVVSQEPVAAKGSRTMIFTALGVLLVLGAGAGWFAWSRARQQPPIPPATTREPSVRLPVASPAELTPSPAVTESKPAAFAPGSVVYAGRIKVVGEPETSGGRAMAVSFSADPKSGTMTQSSKRGDFVVGFNGIWQGSELHAVTTDVVAQPAGVSWTPESFTLQFSPDGQRATYQSVSGGHTYRAELSPLPQLLARLSPVYKGSVLPGNTPIRVSLAADRTSGILTETSKSGDTVVTFTGLWDGDTLRAVTGEIVSKPERVRWQPESFTLRPDREARTLSYSCNDGGKILTATLAVP